jgi:hypothetical protein
MSSKTPLLRWTLLHAQVAEPRITASPIQRATKLSQIRKTKKEMKTHDSTLKQRIGSGAGFGASYASIFHSQNVKVGSHLACS